MKLFFVAAFALFVLSTFDQADSSAYDKIVAHSRIRARKEGWVCTFFIIKKILLSDYNIYIKQTWLKYLTKNVQYINAY